MTSTSVPCAVESSRCGLDAAGVNALPKFVRRAFRDHGDGEFLFIASRN